MSVKKVVIGCGGLGISTTFQVTQPPTLVEGRWRMTVNGVPLVRNASLENRSDNITDVNCEGTNDGFDCAIDHVAGANRMKVCFKLVGSCLNGTKLEASACDTVAPASTTRHHVPESAFKWTGGTCDKAAGLKVSDMKLTPVP
jgi:hypothetical protein